MANRGFHVFLHHVYAIFQNVQVNAQTTMRFIHGCMHDWISLLPARLKAASGIRVAHFDGTKTHRERKVWVIWWRSNCCIHTIPFYVLHDSQAFVDVPVYFIVLTASMSDDHVGMVVFRCRSRQIKTLVVVDGRLSGLDFDGFMNLSFKPAQPWLALKHCSDLNNDRVRYQYSCCTTNCFSVSDQRRMKDIVTYLTQMRLNNDRLEKVKQKEVRLSMSDWHVRQFFHLSTKSCIDQRRTTSFAKQAQY